ncbi:MAG: hypothetical protein KC619_09100 [Myxococcales bacterium]|nr:hypothetical protein [Myxococcales bacterium]
MRRIALSALLTGCAAATPPATSPRADLDAWTAREQDGAPASMTVQRTRFETVRLSAPPPAELPYARRGPRIDVHFVRARLSNALRFLADAADLGIVLGEGLDAEVTADLRRVRPVEAMHALAEAHHVELRIIGRTVIAQRRNGT